MPKATTRSRREKLRILLKCASYLPAVAFLLIGLWEMGEHFANQDKPPLTGRVETNKPAIGKGTPISIPYEGRGDPPLAESVMVLLGVGGSAFALPTTARACFATCA